jgi:hypothetical protein
MSKPVDAWDAPLINGRPRVKKAPHGFLWLLALSVVLGLELWGLSGIELREAVMPSSLTAQAVADRLLRLSPIILLNLLIVWVIKGWFTALWVEGR